jgi:predicted nuclease with TOPRIM domain
MITWMDELRVRQSHLKSRKALEDTTSPKSAFDVEHHVVEAAGHTAAEGPLHLVAVGEARRQLEALMAQEQSSDDANPITHGSEATSAALEEVKDKLKEMTAQRRQDLEKMQDLETETERLRELGQQQDHEVQLLDIIVCMSCLKTRRLDQKQVGAYRPYARGLGVL